jgi:ferric-dicitrate binding protein FerR (iron transport regulator)
MTIHPQDVQRICNQIAGWLAVEPDRDMAIALLDGIMPAPASSLPEAVPVPASPQPAPVPRRPRKRSLATVCAAARKVGAHRVIVDGVTIELSPAAAAPEPTANEWEGEPA